MIQFIIVGWHFDMYPELVQGLAELQEANKESIKVFWSCHREPSESVKANFEYKVFPNLGLEDGAYQQALDYLNIEDDTILFLMHDDIVVKNWEFINECIGRLQRGAAFVGNGVNYPDYMSPTRIYDKEFFPRTVLEVSRPESLHYFQKEGLAYTFRESFLCTVRKHLKDINDFEVVWEEPGENIPIGPMGNMQQSMLGWKITQTYGRERMSYLSNTYMDSEWLYECERGKIKNT